MFVKWRGYVQKKDDLFSDVNKGEIIKTIVTNQLRSADNQNCASCSRYAVVTKTNTTTVNRPKIKSIHMHHKDFNLIPVLLYSNKCSDFRGNVSILCCDWRVNERTGKMTQMYLNPWRPWRYHYRKYILLSAVTGYVTGFVNF